MKQEECEKVFSTKKKKKIVLIFIKMGNNHLSISKTLEKNDEKSLQSKIKINGKIQNIFFFPLFQKIEKS